MSLNFSHRVIIRWAESSVPHGLGVAELSTTFTNTTREVHTSGPFIQRMRMVEFLAGFEWSGAQASYSPWDLGNSDAYRVFEDDIDAIEFGSYWLLDLTDQMTGRTVGWAMVSETVTDED